MPVDIDGVAVQAVAGEIRDVMLTVEMLHPSHDCVECAIHHQGGYVPLRHAELLVRGFRMTEIQWHCASPCANTATESVAWISGERNREHERGFDKCPAKPQRPPRPSAIEGGADTPFMGSSGQFVTLCRQIPPLWHTETLSSYYRLGPWANIADLIEAIELRE